MKKTDTFKLIVGTILNAFVGMPTQDKYEAKTGKPRPMVLSRRMINGVVCAASSIIGLFFGVLPPETVTALLDSGNKLYTVGLENWPIVVSFWTALMGIVGHIKRKK